MFLQAIDRANDTEYGLAASIFTNDYNKALEFAAGVKAGNVWVNGHHIFPAQAPFGGYKLSGVGREGFVGGWQRYNTFHFSFYIKIEFTLKKKFFVFHFPFNVRFNLNFNITLNFKF